MRDVVIFCSGSSGPEAASRSSLLTRLFDAIKSDHNGNNEPDRGSVPQVLTLYVLLFCLLGDDDQNVSFY